MHKIKPHRRHQLSSALGLTGGPPGRSLCAPLRRTRPFQAARPTPCSSWGSLKSQLRRRQFSLVSDTLTPALWGVLSPPQDADVPSAERCSTHAHPVRGQPGRGKATREAAENFLSQHYPLVLPAARNRDREV